MKPRSRIFAIFAGALAVLVLGSGLLLAATGVATVRVHEKQGDGVRLYVPVPALLLHAGIAVVPLAMPARDRARMRAEIGDRGPALAALLAELERCPDAVLVDVQEHGESVQVVKEGRTLAVHVRNTDTDVDVSLPAGVLTHLIQAFTA